MVDYSYSDDDYPYDGWPDPEEFESEMTVPIPGTSVRAFPAGTVPHPPTWPIDREYAREYERSTRLVINNVEQDSEDW